MIYHCLLATSGVGSKHVQSNTKEVFDASSLPMDTALLYVEVFKGVKSINNKTFILLGISSNCHKVM